MSETIEGTATEVATTDGKPKSAVAVLRGQLEHMGPQFKAALPAHMPVERFMRVVMTAVQNNPDLVKADRASLFNSAMRAAQDGLLPDGREGAIVIFNTKVKGPDGKDVWIMKAQWMPMVAGILKKVRNSGELVSIAAHIAYANDTFMYRLGDEEVIEHTPRIDGERGEPRLVYAIARTKDGGIYREIMTIADVDKVRNVSRSKDKGPWVQWWDEMARKTVIRRLAKYLPMSTDLDDLIRRDDDLYDLGRSDAQVEDDNRRRKAQRQTLDSFAAAGSLPKPEGEAETETETVDADGVVQDAPAGAGEETQEQAETDNPAEIKGAERKPRAAKPAKQEDAKPAATGAQPAGGAPAAPADDTAPVPAKPAEAKPAKAATAPVHEPTTEAEYDGYAQAWIDASDDAIVADMRWKNEKNLRNRAAVLGEVREALKKRLDAKLAVLAASAAEG